MSNQLQITGGAKVRSLEGVITGTSGVLGSVPLGAANGVATLDSGGKVPVSQLPSSVVTYLGTWNAATNTPTLVNGVGDAGDMYICNVAGTVNFGAGPVTFAVGDWVLYGSGTWQKSNGQNGTVTSVGASITGNSIGITGSPISTAGTLAFAFAGTSGQYVNGAGNLTTFPTLITSIGLSMPSAFSVANSPLTANGSINVTGAGTTAQYIDGTGALQTFPSIISQASNLVTEVWNESGATLSKGTVVYINGGHGNLPTITKALATSDATSAQTYGVVQTDITNNNNGYVVVIGTLSNLDTQSYAAGTQLYLSSTTAGAWTSTKQYAPAHLVYVGIVVRSHPTQGVVEVKIQNGYEMDELHNVSAQSPVNGAILQYVTSTGLWTAVAGTTTNIAEGTNLYYTDARSRAALSFTAGSGAYNSTTGVITIPTNTSQLTNGANFITLASLSAGTGISYNNLTGVISSTITQYTDALARAAISLTTTGTSGAATYNSTTGVLNIPQYTDAYVGTVTSVGLSAPTGFSVSGSPVTSSGTLALAFAAGYSLPTNVKQSNWDDAYTWVAAFPTQTGNNGKFLTTNGSVLSWADNPLGTVTSVAMTVPTGLSVSGTPITTSGTLAVTLAAGYSIPTTASQTNWDTAYTNRITSATSPLSITSNVISISQATTSTSGYLSSTDWNTFNNKANALSGTINTIAYWDSATTIASLALATYPSLTELSYVKGVTSSIQTQLNGKQGTLTLTTTGTSGAATLVGNTLNIPQYSGGGGTPGGSDTQIQFNDASSFGGSANFTWNKTSNKLIVGGSQTAATGVAQSSIFNPTLVAAANNDVLSAVYINPTFTNGAFTGTANNGLVVASGNVGIGTSTPVSATGYTGFTVYNATTGGIIQTTNGTVDVRMQLSATAGYIGTFSNHDLILNTNTTSGEKVRITASGNVGIGTSTIGSKLQVNGNAAIGYSASTAAPTNGLAVSGNVNIGAPTYSWGTPKYIDIANYGTVSTGDDGTKAYINIGYNEYESAPTIYKYKVGDLASRYMQRAGVHSWYTAASGTANATISFTQAMTLDASANLGLGTTTIGSKLQVNGNAAIGYSASTAAPTNGLKVAGVIQSADTYGWVIGQLAGAARIQHASDVFTLLTTTNGYGSLSANVGTFQSSVTATNYITGGVANTASFAATGYSLTGANAQSLLDLAGTWNTTGNPTAIKLNITNTASGATSNLMDLQVGGVSKMSVDKSGNLTANNVVSGTYTPTVTAGTNCAAVTAFTCQYMRVGNVVTVSGKVYGSATSATTETQFTMTVPINSTLSAAEQCGGTGRSAQGGAIPSGAGYVASISADSANTVRFSYTAPATLGTGGNFWFSFTYLIS